MDRIALWGPWTSDPSVDDLSDYIYDAMWFLKRCGDESLRFESTPRWWDMPEAAQPELVVVFSLGEPGALEFALPGDELRSLHGMPEIGPSGVKLLSELGWINPILSGIPVWRLPAPWPLEGFVRRYAELLAKTCLHAFNTDPRHLLLQFLRETPAGAPEYRSPLPFLLQGEAELYY